MATTTTLLTAEQFWEIPDSRKTELIDGVVVELSPPGLEHGNEQILIGSLLLEAQRRGVGRVLGEIGCIIRRNPDAVRAPDVAFIKQERLGDSERLPKTFFEGAPDLVVEIASPSDRPGEIQTKIREWIEGGASLVWIVYPDTRTVHVVESMQRRFTLTADDVIEGGIAVPGFSCRVGEFFT